MNAKEVKSRLFDLGADLCGIAGADRFGGAPQGFHPRDVLPGCQSVIVFAKRFLAATARCKTTVPYTVVRNILSDQMDHMAVAFCADFETLGYAAVPTGTNGPTEFDTGTQRFRNIVSAKHCAVAAGLGTIGRNTLLITPEYGNMVWLSVILTELALEADPMRTDNPCGDSCRLCVEACPIGAVGEPEMKQQACWDYAFGAENGGDFKIKCNRCRVVCPHTFGTHNRLK